MGIGGKIFSQADGLRTDSHAWGWRRLRAVKNTQVKKQNPRKRTARRERTIEGGWRNGLDAENYLSYTANVSWAVLARCLLLDPVVGATGRRGDPGQAMDVHVDQG